MWLRMNLTYHGIMGTSIAYPRMEHEGNVWDGESGWMSLSNFSQGTGKFHPPNPHTGIRLCDRLWMFWEVFEWGSISPTGRYEG